jgi:hypothetical protein
MKPLITQFYPIYYYFFSVASRYVSQHPVLEHPHSVFIPHYMALCSVLHTHSEQQAKGLTSCTVTQPT